MISLLMHINKENNDPKVYKIDTVDPLSSDSYNSSFIEEMSPSYDNGEGIKIPETDNRTRKTQNLKKKLVYKHLNQAEFINQMFSERVNFNKKCNEKSNTSLSKKKISRLNFEESPISMTNKNKKKIKVHANISPINIEPTSARKCDDRDKKSLRIKTNQIFPNKKSNLNLHNASYTDNTDEEFTPHQSHDYSSKSLINRKTKLERTPQSQFSSYSPEKSDLARSVNSIHRLNHLKDSIFSKRNRMADHSFFTVSKRRNKFSNYLVFNPWNEGKQDQKSMRQKQFSLPRIHQNSIQAEPNLCQEPTPKITNLIEKQEDNNTVSIKRMACKSNSMQHFESVKQKCKKFIT
ncbi:unnamed protein product [Moneuplotes crassus]|uniref:Uncharacterized protein n=1 Tax=Euplotes crassus TaxID=5936 RepID=A0AAD1X999_EUPCR|nr:unnamed protein product [Moneuplotes crassus]